MLRNHIRVILRRLRKDLGYTAVNLIGLTIGLTVSLLIAFYVQHEWSFDRFHEHANRIYRISMTEAFQGEEVPVLPPAPLGPAVEKRLSGIEQTVRIRYTDQSVSVARPGQDPVREPRMSFADVALFDVFGFTLRRGNPETALTQPRSIVLSAAAAKTYFGAADPVGKTLTINQGTSYTVTGVLAQPPGPSHLSFDLLASYTTLPTRGVDTEEWTLGANALYVRAAPGRDASAIRSGIARVVKGTIDAPGLRVMPEPITEVHLHGQRTRQQPLTGDPRYLWLFSAIAGLVLLMACVNYANLASARSLRNVQEVGVHKALGARRWQLAVRYLTESVLLCLGAFVIAGGLANALLPWFENVLGTNIRILPGLWTVLGVFAVIVLGTGLLAGAYPAIYLSRFAPIRVLNDDPSSGGSSRGLVRTGLVVFQFAMSVALMVGALVVHDQLSFMQDHELGFDAENLIVLDAPPSLQDRYSVFKEELHQVAGVQGVTMGALPGHKHVPIVSVRPEGADDFDWVPTFSVDPDFISTMDIDLQQGRALRPSDSTGADAGVLVNEAALAKFGWDEAVGKRIEIPGDGGLERRRVVGVVDNFHYGSLRKSIQPAVVRVVGRPGDFANVLVRVAPTDLDATTAEIRNVWSKVASPAPFAYRFMDREFDSYYRSMRQIGKIVGVAAGLAIIIAALGLFGLAAYVVERRTKEIGIRKALGATASSIVRLLSKDVLALVALAFIGAAPIAYVSLDYWLQRFAYRTEIGPAVFLLVGGATVLIAGLAVSTQALRAAWTDPATAIRQE
jgi:putative ABC transport system permease protein